MFDPFTPVRGGNTVPPLPIDLNSENEIGDGDYKEMWSSLCSIQPQGLGVHKVPPYKYIGLGYW